MSMPVTNPHRDPIETPGGSDSANDSVENPRPKNIEIVDEEDLEDEEQEARDDLEDPREDERP
jgi:hypothetical protein